MPLSLTCTCGAKLEVDEKFRGQIINCPDCNKPLPTVLPPRVRRKTSLFALVSPLLALIGAFTLIGPLLAVACGLVGLRNIGRTPELLAGRRLAKAGIGLGLVFSLVSVAAFFWADWLGLDGLVRGLDWADKLDYTGDLQYTQEQTQGRGFSLKKPSLQWGRFTGASSAGDQKGDLLVLAHLREDAYIVVLEGFADIRDDLDERRFKAKDRIQESPFLRRLGRLGPKDKFPDLSEFDYKQITDTDILEFKLDTRLAGIPRILWLRVQRVGTQLFVVVCLTRKHRFDRLEDSFERVLQSFNVEN